MPKEGWAICERAFDCESEISLRASEECDVEAANWCRDTGRGCCSLLWRIVCKDLYQTSALSSTVV